jgi:urea transport system permease protein
MVSGMVRILLTTLLFSFGIAQAAVDPALLSKLGGDNDEKIAAIHQLAASADPDAAKVLKSMADGELKVDGQEVVVNNRVRREIDAALAGLRLFAPEREVRAAAVKELAGTSDDALRPIVKKALAAEKDAGLRESLALIAAAMDLKAPDKETRLAAVRMLAGSSDPNARNLLQPIADPAEPDAELRRAAQESVKSIEARVSRGQFAGLVFSALSLGSILLLAALGLAITYGLMGVINMAHGELIMIGAYTTYVVQNLFRQYAPGAFDAYLLVAVPAAFAISAAVGMALERSVVRWLYGRPLETLLATWGISLILIQGVRTIFGAQNVQVENPSFMSGGVEIFTGVVLPFSRIVIIGFAAVVLLAVATLLARTRLGLFVRAVTQNRAMASCVGVRTPRVDTWAFGLGSGLAGLAGCALSQIGNVGPDLGQSYIVDSFLVVVLGGVGQLAGTVYAALGLGLANKLLETWQGAVIAKIVVLVFIIVFIQKRPQGLFAMKGRAVES